MRRIPLLLLLTLAAAPAAAAPGDGPAPLPTPEPTIVGGAPVPAGQWRDTAGILFSGDVSCTGVLIAPNLVLTAGHCSGGIDGVLLDTVDLGDPGEIINVIQEIPYPRWWQTYDATLLVLERDSVVPPRTIGNGCVRDNYLVDGAPVQIVGYGAINESGTAYDDFLREARTVVTDHDCTSISRGCVSSISPGGEIGAGGDGIDTCYGDSGGPLYLVTEKGDFLVGLTSRAWDDVTIDCAQGGIYVRPDALMEWIETTSGVDLPDASCNLAPAPTAEPIEAEAGGDGGTVVVPNDPDSSNHSYAIGTPPAQGSAEVGSDGAVTYHAPDDFQGEDPFTVVVTDDGDPTASGTVSIAVTVVDAGGCGCRAGASPRATGGLLLLALLVLVRLRSSAWRRCARC